MMKLHIDEREIEAKDGDSILEAALRANLYIPHLCHHPDLEAKGGCRLCSVEIEGEEEPLPSCMTKAEDGMVVTVRGPKADEVRKTAMELILASHPADCTGCPKYGKCELQSLYQYLGVSPERWRKKSQAVSNDNSNPLIQHLFTRCVRCGRCIRACQDLRGVGVLDYIKTEQGVRAGIPEGKSLIDGGCRFCGACIEVCPTGSIMDAIGIVKDDVSYADSAIPCKAACPAHVDIPRYVRYIKEGDYQKAIGVMRETVPLPAVLGSICEHKCEIACKRNELGEPVSICKLKQTAAMQDQGFWKEKISLSPPSGKKAAVLGAGPAGLTAAYYLAKKGHHVTLFEKNEKAGGQCRYGIPAYRLPGELLDKEIGDILELGIDLKTSAPIEKPVSLLNEGYDAVLVSVGTHKGMILPIEGHDLKGVSMNTEFLKQVRMGDAKVSGDVIVLGGGNVAYDCARSAIRLGAEQVHIVCLENEEQMTASLVEREEGKEEGVQLHAAHSFLKISGSDKVEGVEVQQVSNFSFDENRKAVIELKEGTHETIPADMVIFAIGQKPEGTEAMGLALTHGPYIKVNDSMETNLSGIFAVGDVVTGTKSVIEAIAASRKTVQIVDKFLGGDGDITDVLVEPEKKNPHIGPREGFAGLERQYPCLEDSQIRRTGFMPVEFPLNDEAAQCEAERCLQCDLRLELAQPKLWTEY